MKILSYSQAKAAGLKRYFTEVACPKGHVSEKYVSNQKCIRCIRDVITQKRAGTEYGSLDYYRNKPKRQVQYKEWCANNKEAHAARIRNYKARKREAEGTHSADDVMALWKSQCGVCNTCPADLTSGYHVDHVMPLSRGGSNGPENLQLLCPACNCSKGAKTMSEFKRGHMNTSLQQSDTGDERLNEAQKELGLRLAQYRNNDPTLTRRTVKEMQGMVDDYRNSCKRKDVVFPKLTVVAFLKMNHVCIWPAELPQEELQKRMRMFIIHRQRHDLVIDAEDMAKGVRRAYPDYSPSRFNLVCPPTANQH